MANSVTTTQTAAQEERLRAEMKQDAERKARRIIDRARREAGKLLDEVRREVSELRRVRLAMAQHTAEDQVSAILAGVEHETRRRRLIAREEVIRAALSRALERAASTQGNERKKILTAALSQAIADFPDDRFRIHCSPDDVARVRESADTLPEGTEIVADPSVTGGIVIVSEDGVRRYENSFEARLERMRELLRVVAYRALMAPGTESE